jgi:hypothetical protein
VKVMKMVVIAMMFLLEVLRFCIAVDVADEAERKDV